MKSELKDITSNIGRITGILERGQCWRLVFALSLMVIAGGLVNIPPVVLGKLLDSVVNTNSFVFLKSLPLLGIILASILIKEAIQVLRKCLVEDTCTRIEKSNRVILVNHLLKLDLNFFANKQTGSLHGRMNRSLDGLVKLIKLSFLDFLPSVFAALFALGVVLVKAPVLGIVMALVIPAGVWIVLHQVASQKGIRIDLLRGKEEIDGTVVELLGGIENVRIMHSERHEISRIETLSEYLRAKEIIHHIYMAGYDAAKYINEGVFHVAVLALAIWLASKQLITTGEILTYSMLFVGVITPLREIHRILDEAHESSIRTNDLFEMMDLPMDESFNEPLLFGQAHLLPVKGETAIEILNLNLTYPGADVPILKDVSLRINTGEFIGIVGSTGCGKSTLLKAFLRLNHPQKGAIKLFGKKLEDVTRKEISDVCCYVSQNPFIISGSVYDNIVYGLKRDNITFAEVEAAAKKACIHDDIMNFQNRYDTGVGERGCKLSGGERQRIAIARAFLRRPALLVLDEATSALDTTNESAVQKAIEELMQNSTVIAVAHRLSTLRNTDRLFVMENGKIVQTGTYNELTGKEDQFSKFRQVKDGSQELLKAV